MGPHPGEDPSCPRRVTSQICPTRCPGTYWSVRCSICRVPVRSRLCGTEASGRLGGPADAPRQTKDQNFQPAFGDLVHKIGGGRRVTGREVYFALYQSLEQGEDDQTLFRQYRRDCFDLIIVDECRRGSARADSQWRAIPEYFAPATQVGMTATPISTREADSFQCFGEQVYTYALAEGIQDGFLAPYQVQRVSLNVDVEGFRPDPGLALLEDFRKTDTEEPVIAVTSKLLTTGLDLPAVRNIVIFRRIASMPEFKQIIGRGTRLCPEIGKGSFDIVDFVEATVLFNDPRFDGPPLRIQYDEADEDGRIATIGDEEPDSPGGKGVAEPDADHRVQDEGTFDDGDAESVIDDDDVFDQIRASGWRFYVNGVEVYQWREAHYRLDSDGWTMRLITYRQWVRDRVLELDLTPGQLRAEWAQVKSREALVRRLAEADIDLGELATKLENPDVDAVDLLVGVAWGLPLVSREERMTRLRGEQRSFLAAFAPPSPGSTRSAAVQVRGVGATELSPQVLQVPPINDLGIVTELAARFDGTDGLHSALDELGKRLFDVA